MIRRLIREQALAKFRTKSRMGSTKRLTKAQAQIRQKKFRRQSLQRQRKIFATSSLAIGSFLPYFFVREYCRQRTHHCIYLLFPCPKCGGPQDPRPRSSELEESKNPHLAYSRQGGSSGSSERSTGRDPGQTCTREAPSIIPDALTEESRRSHLLVNTDTIALLFSSLLIVRP